MFVKTKTDGHPILRFGVFRRQDEAKIDKRVQIETDIADFPANCFVKCRSSASSIKDETIAL